MRTAFRPVTAGPDLLYSEGGAAGPGSTSEKNTKQTQFAQPTRNQWVASEATGSNDLADRSTRAIPLISSLALRRLWASPVPQASAAVLPKPAAVGLDTLAILKMGTATTVAALDKREKTKQTKFLVTILQSVSCSLILVSGR